jgi:hypothetical protein
MLKVIIVAQIFKKLTVNHGLADWQILCGLLVSCLIMRLQVMDF